ncbi:MAG TPA: lipid A export permease/ATP-binding protein MsbA [Steroidobacteraceae bacterium]|nr:lipid A export permease/ATP-binding protein MsbA [Steroidobacteraceae bacterium]
MNANSAASAGRPKPNNTAWAIYRRLLRYARPYIGVFLIGVVGMILFAATNSALAYLVKEFLNGAFVKKNPEVLWKVPIAVVVLFTLRGIGDFVSNYYPSWVGRQVIKGLRRDVFSHYLRLPTPYLDRAQSGHLLSKLTNNIELVASAATSAAISLIGDSLTIIGLLITLFYMNWRLAAFCITVAPVIAWLMQVANRSFRRYSERIQTSMGDITRVAKEAIDAHRLIKIFNAEDHQIDRFEQVNELNRASNMKLARAKSISNPVVQCIASIALASVLYVAIRQVFSHNMQVDEFLGFLTALMLIPSPLRSLVNMSGPLQQGIAAGQSVFEIMDEPTEGAGGVRRIVRARGEIEFRNVSFTYGGDKGDVLHEVSFRVQPGETVAIVGRSGSGKTTLVGLVPRFYDVQQGSVLLDGVDVREYRLTDLRSQVSLVSQDVVLFNDTIRNNIAFNAIGKTDEQIAGAARAANVMEFVAQQPDGFDTVLSDRGQNLSGGQRQRISIARALLKDAPVLILDEATAALDNESERRVQQELAVLMRGRTTLVIAHRLSTVEGADRIIVLDHGRIAEMGNHQELLVRGGLYAALHGMQFND